MQQSSSTTVLICGAGIAGIASAYHLAVRQGIGDVTLVDERPPLTLTSDKSTEAYRNWWPAPDDSMIRLMNRSIDLLEELAYASDNRFLLNRRGYIYATAKPDHAEQMQRTAEQTARMGAGPLRVHAGTSSDPPYLPSPAEGFNGAPDGADLLLDSTLIRQHYPYITQEAVGLLHVRRAGWFSGQQLGMYLLEQAQAHGVKFINQRVTEVSVASGSVRSVRLADGTTITVEAFVNAAGPMLKDVGQMLDLDLPVFSERHIKASFPDHEGIIPRNAPLLIWSDPQRLNWSAEERAALDSDSELRWLLNEMPGGVHCRPEGGTSSENILILWPYDAEPVAEVFPLPDIPLFPEIAMRGMSRMIPALENYIERLPRPYIDGGYYTKTRENRPLACPLPIEGAYVIGALSGFGLMASLSTGELLAAHVSGNTLPEYAPAFNLTRYEDPQYLKLLDDWGPSAQL